MLLRDLRRELTQMHSVLNRVHLFVIKEQKYILLPFALSVLYHSDLIPPPPTPHIGPLGKDSTNIIKPLNRYCSC